MNLIIQRLDEHNFRDMNRCDGTFTVDSKLVLHAENNATHYTIVSVPPYQKRYPAEELDFTTYLNHPYFDCCLYMGINPDRDEIALYGYLLFADISS